MKFKIYLSVKFRAFGITFGTVKKEWERDLPREIKDGFVFKPINEKDVKVEIDLDPLVEVGNDFNTLITATVKYRVPIFGYWNEIQQETEVKFPSTGTHTAIKERGINLTYEWTRVAPTILRDTDKIKP